MIAKIILAYLLGGISVIVYLYYRATELEKDETRKLQKDEKFDTQKLIYEKQQKDLLAKIEDLENQLDLFGKLYRRAVSFIAHETGVCPYENGDINNKIDICNKCEHDCEKCCNQFIVNETLLEGEHNGNN